MTSCGHQGRRYDPTTTTTMTAPAKTHAKDKKTTTSHQSRFGSGSLFKGVAVIGSVAAIPFLRELPQSVIWTPGWF